MFLQHLKSCEDTRFFCSNGGSVVCRVAHEHAFSGVDGDGRDGQCRFVGNVHFPHAVVVNAKPLYPFAVDLLGIVSPGGMGSTF